MSLLIFAAASVLFVRSWFVCDHLWYRTPDGAVTWTLSLSHGSFRLVHLSVAVDPPHSLYWDYHPQPPIRLEIPPYIPTSYHFAGFGFGINAGIPSSSVIVPLWIFLPTLIPPLLWLRRYRNERRRGFPIDAPSSSATGERSEQAVA
jgi:hypothetical protein